MSRNISSTLPDVPWHFHLLFQQPLYISNFFSNFTHPLTYLKLYFNLLFIYLYFWNKWKNPLERKTPYRKGKGTGLKIQFLSFPKFHLALIFSHSHMDHGYMREYELSRVQRHTPYWNLPLVLLTHNRKEKIPSFFVVSVRAAVLEKDTEFF